MSRSEAEALVKEALVLAMSRDGSSGGVARLVTIHSAGVERTLVLPEVPRAQTSLRTVSMNETREECSP